MEPQRLFWALREREGFVMLLVDNESAYLDLEALPLERLSDYQISVAELGTFTAAVNPIVPLKSNSNSTREHSPALRHRYPHLHIWYPDSEIEQRIPSAPIRSATRRPANCDPHSHSTLGIRVPLSNRMAKPSRLPRSIACHE